MNVWRKGGRKEKGKWRAWGTNWSLNAWKNAKREDKELKREIAEERWRPRHCCKAPPDLWQSVKKFPLIYCTFDLTHSKQLSNILKLKHLSGQYVVLAMTKHFAGRSLLCWIDCGGGVLGCQSELYSSLKLPSLFCVYKKKLNPANLTWWLQEEFRIYVHFWASPYKNNSAVGN